MPDLVRITGFTIIDNGHPNKDGDVLVGRFDAEYAGLRLVGCSLYRTGPDSFVAHGPRLPGPAHASRPAVQITGDVLRHQFTEAARSALGALGGDVEWRPPAVA